MSALHEAGFTNVATLGTSLLLVSTFDFFPITRNLVSSICLMVMRLVNELLIGHFNSSIRLLRPRRVFLA